MKRRWASFHGDMRAMSGNRLQRTLGRMLGDDTWRYKTARFIFRPPLQLARRMRSTSKAESVRLDHQVASNKKLASRVFPINSEPQVGKRLLQLAPLELNHEDVIVVVVNEVDSSPEAVIESLNETIRTTDATWLFLIDVSCSSSDRASSLSALLGHAADGDDVVYADEVGLHDYSPIFKSAEVGPHTLLSYNVVGRPALLRVETLRRVEGFAPDAGWAFEHDLYLRLLEVGGQFHHITHVLPAGRAPISFDSAHVDEDTCRVVANALRRRGLAPTVEPGPFAGVVRWRVPVPDPQPSVDIIIPTRDRIDLVQQCIDAIERLTTYQNYDIIILDNDSAKAESHAFFAQTKYRVVPCPGPFNYAHIVNRGIHHSSADFVLTLNNDTILTTPDWLERMVSVGSLPEVGIVGACLLDQDGRREHESIVISPYPQHLRTDSNYPHVDQFSVSVRDVAAVTGAVQLVRREFWESLGGMDELLKVTMNDVDICLRAQLEDRYVVYLPDVRLFHHVSSSRGSLDPLEDRNRFIRRWDIFGSFRDPYFPEALLLLGETMYFLPR